MWIGIAIAGALLGCCLAACAPAGSDESAVQVAAGTLGGNAWVAKAGLAGGSGICLEVTLEGSDPNRICGLREGESGLWRFDVPGGSFVTGTTAAGTAATVHLILADGSEQSAPVVRAGELTSLRFFVIALPPGAALDRFEILDDGGLVIENRPVD
jgi:hypothetical protein